MSDLIERQAAINAALIVTNGYFGNTFGERFRNKLKKKLEDLPSVEPEKELKKEPKKEPNEWIPMSERNPTVGQDVLVTTRKGKIYVVTYAIKEWMPEHCFRWKPNFMGTEYLDANDVIAWMSLPKPYQEDKR